MSGADIWGRTLEAEGTARAKACGEGHVWCVRGPKDLCRAGRAGAKGDRGRKRRQRDGQHVEGLLAQ